MYIRNLFKEKKQLLSFEVFPPKKDTGEESVKAAVDELVKLPADYISVTYGAGGSTSKRTADIAEYIQNTHGMAALAHLSCITADRESIELMLGDMKLRGIENVLALRGDLPADGGEIASDYQYASELVEDIRLFGGFCIGGACYPECHPDSPDLETDIENLKRKVDAGCDFLVTQMFFDNEKFYEFRELAAKKGIDIPMVAGIMPLTQASQIQRMCILSGGASLPSKFTRMIGKYENKPEALKQAGIAYAVDQITDLLANDIRGIHIYTMNKPETAKTIVSAVSSMF